MAHPKLQAEAPSRQYFSFGLAPFCQMNTGRPTWISSSTTTLVTNTYCNSYTRPSTVREHPQLRSVAGIIEKRRLLGLSTHYLTLASTAISVHATRAQRRFDHEWVHKNVPPQDSCDASTITFFSLSTSTKQRCSNILLSAPSRKLATTSTTLFPPQKILPSPRH